jgi:formate--tetrahydrofolate ligase
MAIIMNRKPVSNLEIARAVALRPIADVAAEMGLDEKHVELFGRHKAKVELDALASGGRKGNLVLVTAMTPTAAGEGKTTTTVGIGQALRRLGKQALVALREPSLGPVFGVKGGGCGGGRSQVLPMEEINLFFNGDLYAVSAARNLLAAWALPVCPCASPRRKTRSSTIRAAWAGPRASRSPCARCVCPRAPVSWPPSPATS